MAMDVLRRMLSIAIAGAIGAFGGTYACTLDLDRRIACGDGYTDLEAGEACDPGDPGSFQNACLGTPRELGTAECDAMTCTIIADAETCGRCGDGIVDEVRGEECEGEFGEELCAAGGAVPCVGCMLRHDQCETCGNGIDDPGEECDPAGGSFAVPISCVELTPRFPAKPYAGGTTSTCTPLCTRDRSGCTYCGDGQRDDAIAVDTLGNESYTEVCDGEDKFDPDILSQFPDCQTDDPFVVPNITCGANCLDVTVGEVRCCLRKGAPCPDPDAEFRCCYEHANPGSTGLQACDELASMPGESACK